MKIVKANQSVKISINEQEWLAIGKKAGWVTAQTQYQGEQVPPEIAAENLRRQQWAKEKQRQQMMQQHAPANPAEYEGERVPPEQAAINMRRQQWAKQKKQQQIQDAAKQQMQNNPGTQI